ncbi:imidazolonepropionase [Alteromonas sediminis]|uniref:Imidazolonepropionase n=1 Tax=Alteromonas sediminis TaxID=2259342 RepID=A0A3N5Y5X9_9ALTE|nr:imidazolonepropionase [Alteromonas sediminis]RPJ68673.1 imidazolonepropionase [Alteromonas sediminis]
MDKVYTHATLATLSDTVTQDYGLISDAALGIDQGKISWIGQASEVASLGVSQDCIIDVAHKLITPGLIDCHTHLVFGGNRAKEFEMRLTGVSYEDIARQGGGINATVSATRAATEDHLFLTASRYLKTLIQEGVTSIEIKSGYGLDTETEKKMLRVATRLRNTFPINVKRTFLGAHAIPPEFKNNADGYITYVTEQTLPELVRHDLVDHVDIFCENIAFDLNHAEQLFEAATHYGLSVKMHAGQLSDMSGPSLVGKYRGLSADHLEYLSEACVATMAEKGVTAVLLPGAFYTLRETQKPPIELLRKYKVPIAIASDFNPGSSPLCSLRMMMNMACTLFQLTPQEALTGVTRHAACAFGRNDLGVLEVGKKADLVVWDATHPAELSYQFRTHQVLERHFA